MRKVIGGINITLDGFCDHTAMLPDEELHDHYTDVLNQADVILYGSITYQLMQFWQPLVKHPSGEKSMDDFAVAIDKIHKIVFSRKLKNVGWETASLSNQTPEDVIIQLRQLPGKDILVGSRSLLISLVNQGLIDELQICVHPVVVGKGLPLFDQIAQRTFLKLLKTKIFESGTILLCYKPG
jgi:dihydrofolate reductase